MRFSKRIVFIVLLLTAVAVWAVDIIGRLTEIKPQFNRLERTEGSVSFTVRTVSNHGVYAPRNAGAIWVTDANNTFVKTIKVWASTYRRHLVKWNSMSGGNTTGAITGASLNSHTTHTVSWNCLNYAGQSLPDGNYRMYVEYTENNSANAGVADGPYTYVEFTKGPEGVSLSPANLSYFTNMQLTYTPVNPFSITDFTAEEGANNSADLHFSTVNESGLTGFNILRGTTGEVADAQYINSPIIAATNAAGPNHYSFNDPSPIIGNNFYWVATVAANGAITYTGPINYARPGCELSSFRGVREDANSVQLSWTTAYEIALDSFNIYRYRVGHSEEMVLVNANPITPGNTMNTQDYSLIDPLAPGDSLIYVLKMTTMTGNTEALAQCFLASTAAGDVTQPVLAPRAYPNPFNPTTTFSYTLAKSTKVRAEVYNSRGQKVACLANEVQSAGLHRLVWQANHQTSGVYMVRVVTPQGTAVSRVVLVK